MQEKHLYEYAVIRVLPRVEREEFVNTGIILFCKKDNFIKVLFKINEKRLLSLAADFDFEQLNANLLAFEKIASGASEGGPISQFDVASRFRWLTAIRSSSIQTSRPHPGLCADLEKTLERLMADIVI